MLLTGAQIRIGKIGGHEIRLDLIAFGMLVLWVYLARGDAQSTISFAVAAFLSILIHELGHAGTIRKLTGENTLVVLGFGGATISLGPNRAHQQFQSRLARPAARKQLLISLAGPAAQIAIGVVGWAAAHWLAHFRSWLPWDFYTGTSIWLLALHDFIWISMIWSVLNLAPMLPLDGGQALRALLIALGGGVRKVRRVTRILSVAVAAAVGVWAYEAGYRIALLLLLFFIVLPVMDEARREGW